MKAIAPNEVAGRKQAIIPERVIEIVNDLIVKHYSGTRAVVGQDEIVAAIRADNTLDSTRIYEDKWLDFEPLFRASGWTVVYDKPAYNESFRPSFEFSVPR